MIDITREIDGAPDFELGLPRENTLQFDVTWPDEGEAAGLVLVIAGFGDDTASDYSRTLRRHIVETTGMAAVSVRYHAFHSRPGNGATVRIEPREHAYLVGEAAMRNAPVKDYNNVPSLAAGLKAVGADIRPRIMIDPAKGEYQNFGVMQALDHLRVIGDLVENAPAFDTRRIVALGSSHGGYIAHLIAKLAPSTLAAVIDNSSYVQPPMSYLGIGDIPEAFLDIGGLPFHARVLSGWSISDRASANFYSRDHDLIRDLRFPPHVATMRAASADHGTQYFMVNASRDDISRPEAKQRQQATLARAGFSSELTLVGPEGIDGELFKTHAHGLGCSLKRLFDRYIGRVQPRVTDLDGQLRTTIAYDGVEHGYRFRHLAHAPYAEAEVYDLFGDSDAGEDHSAATATAA